MSGADINDLRCEALTGGIDKVESYLEKIVQHITIHDTRHATDSPLKKRRIEMTSEKQVRLGPLLQLAVQDHPYKPRSQTTTRFPLWLMKISVIIKGVTLIMK